MITAEYLKDTENQGVQHEFKFKALDTTLTVYTDSDWTGCRSSRNSASGGVVSTTIGVVKHWSSRHRLVALSSCEAEVYAMNEWAAEAMEIRCMAADIGITFNILLRTDASAALGVVNRCGVGKTRDIATQIGKWRCRRSLARREPRFYGKREIRGA